MPQRAAWILSSMSYVASATIGVLRPAIGRQRLSKASQRRVARQAPEFAVDGLEPVEG